MSIYMMHIVEVEEEKDLYETIIDTYEHNKKILNAAYKRVKNKFPAPTKKQRGFIRRAIEVGVSLADEMYDDSDEYVGMSNYKNRLNKEVEQIGGSKATAAEKSIIRYSVEIGISEAIKDKMVKEGRYY